MIDGVIIKQLKAYEDERGTLAEFFRSDEIESGIMPAMGYASFTKPSVSRGPHEHRGQTDYFFFPGVGDFLLVLWDNRESSPTFRRRDVVRTSDRGPCIAVIPPGVVHAYHCVSQERGLVVNVPNRLYRGEGKADDVDEIRHEDDPSSPYVIDLTAVVEEFHA
jgi:dTDP-4-dehydrorhamnose 3,5-epimerase